MPTSRPTTRLVQILFGDQKGAAAIEFAILAVPFFLIVFAILEVALLFAAELVLDKAAWRVGRDVRTGIVQSKQMSKADFQSLVCKHVEIMLDCTKIVFDLRTYADFADIPTTTPTNGNEIDTSSFGYDYGKSDTIVALRIYYKWPINTNVLRPFFANTSDGSSIILGNSVFRREPL